MRRSVRSFRPTLRALAAAAALASVAGPARPDDAIFWTGPSSGGYWDNIGNWSKSSGGQPARLMDNEVYLGANNTEFRYQEPWPRLAGLPPLPYVGQLDVLAINSPGILAVTGGFLHTTGTMPGQVSVLQKVVVSGGRLDLQGGLTNFDLASGTLQGGSYKITGFGDLTLPGELRTNAANLVLDGTSSYFSRKGERGYDKAFGIDLVNDTYGSLSLLNGAVSELQGRFTNAGTLVVGPSASVYKSVFQAYGTFTNTQTGLMTLSGGIVRSRTRDFQNYGTVSGYGWLTASGSLDNKGSLVASGGTLTVDAGLLSDMTAGELRAGGSYSAIGNGVLMLRLKNGNTPQGITQNGARILLDGPNAQIVDGNSSLLRYFSENAQGGSFTIQNGANFTTAAGAYFAVPGGSFFDPTVGFKNYGLLKIGANSTFTSTNTFTNSGTVQVGDGGRLYLPNGSSSGGSFELSGSGALDFGGGSHVLNGTTGTGTGAMTVLPGASINTSGAVSLSNVFNNKGQVKVSTGQLSLSGGGVSSAPFAVLAGATLNFSGGSQALSNFGGGATMAGKLLVSGAAIVNVSGAPTLGGTLAISGGAFNVGDAMSANILDLNGGASLGGTGNVSFSGASSWAAGTLRDAGTTSFKGTLALGAGQHEVIGGKIEFSGASTWTAGDFRTRSRASLVNTGSFLDQTMGASIGDNKAGTDGSSFVNQGSYTKSQGLSTTTIYTTFSNDGGTVNVNAGDLVLAGGGTSTGGRFNVVGGANIQFKNGGHTLNNSAFTGAGGVRVAGATVTAASASVTSVDGPFFLSAGSVVVFGGLTLKGTSTWTGGSFTGQVGVLSNAGTGSFLDKTTQSSSIGQSGVIGSFSNAGSYTKSGASLTTIQTNFSNSGALNADAGTLRLMRGLQGSGSLAIGAAGTVDLRALSSVGWLAISGNSASGGALLLGANNITVSGDYNNARSDVGNTFNRRAGISGTGMILAAGTTQQTISGAAVSNGSTSLATLAIALRVGQQAPATASFTINNVGSGGTSLRGAIQTGGITSAALSGSGVTAQNWGAVAQGQSSPAFVVSFDPKLAQSLVGQSIQIGNNFDNVAGQTLAIASHVYAPAVARVNSPATLDFGIVRVGDAATRKVSVSNTAAGKLTDQLSATLSGGGASFVTGSNALVTAGDSANLGVTLDIRTAGVFNAAGSLAFASHNAEMADLALGSAGLTFTAQVNNLAVAALDKTGGGGSFAASCGGNYVLNFGTLTLGSSGIVTTLSLSNAAQGTADALAGSFSSLVPGGAFTLSGATDFANLKAGEALSGLQIRFDTGSPGSFDQVLTLSTLSTNASDPLGRTLGNVELRLQGMVTAVPEPGSWLLMAGGLLWLGSVGRRRLQNRAA